LRSTHLVAHRVKYRGRGDRRLAPYLAAVGETEQHVGMAGLAQRTPAGQVVPSQHGPGLGHEVGRPGEMPPVQLDRVGA